MSRKEVLSLYKRLLRTVEVVFKGDEANLWRGRAKVRADFAANAAVTSDVALAELIKHGSDCDRYLREHVVQAELNPDTGNYRLNIREETRKYDNSIFRTDISTEEYKKANRKARKKCSDNET